MKLNKNILILLVIIICILFGAFLVSGSFMKNTREIPVVEKDEEIIEISGVEENEKQVIVGGDRDEHGCIGSAGYTWCQEKQKCLRTWEELCIDK